jgi:hypothetical protein
MSRLKETNARSDRIAAREPVPTNLYQRGITMPSVPPLQTTYIHAVAYARLFLEMIDHIFPGQKYITLSETQCQMVRNATDNLLTVSKWRVESGLFTATFGIEPPLHYQPRPEGTELGAASPEPQTDAKLPG